MALRMIIILCTVEKAEILINAAGLTSINFMDKKPLIKLTKVYGSMVISYCVTNDTVIIVTILQPNG